MKKILTAGKNDKGLRLDLFLSLNLDQYTRSFIKKQINENRVKVNGKEEYRANYKVKEGDKVSINFKKEENKENIKAENIKIDVLYEDDDLIAVNKPEGMVVHPATGNYSGTLMNALLYHYKKLSSVGSKIRAGLINRIDKDTSGIVLVGKSNKALWFYSRQFANREVEKTYLAAVKGDFSKLMKGREVIKISNYLARNPKNRMKYTIVEPSRGRIAISNFKLISVSKNKKYSLVEAKIETGRTHQIRVHLSSLGYPVIGDRIYSGMRWERLLLHSFKIRIGLLSGKHINIKAKIKGDFKKFLISNFNKKNIADYI